MDLQDAIMDLHTIARAVMKRLGDEELARQLREIADKINDAIKTK